uniref:NAD-dependent epimerase/dehydratase domain-containing protein n=1 Tax=Aegilops tauschii subsp. strangulata TaxID=200361 RepID=A0A453D2P6_AEGTS
MSAGEGRKTACVTGGSGYIAAALIKLLLQKGYAVKTTVRDPGWLFVSSFIVLSFMYFSNLPFKIRPRNLRSFGPCHAFFFVPSNFFAIFRQLSSK